ncbi:MULTISPECIES: hypothetical protein [Actinosynnema]|uniref:hypothetical protein n=1 Tax=Actinosynnema TaxID=40566 RepID=UPI0020A25E3F|nr:hypothetical protein [Actinosynnema pretiosum]MCP2094716.1 hypothetical protein [Actinosynnema pretiosum]
MNGATGGPAEGARLLRRLREKRGWSWSDLARGLRDTADRLALPSPAPRQVVSIQRAVARWESPADRTRPGDRYQFLLAHLYARTPGGEVVLGADSDFAILLEALRHFGMTDDRAVKLVELVTFALAPQAEGHLSGDADPDLVHRLRMDITGIDSLIGTDLFIRLQLRLSPVLDACRHLLRTDRGGERQEVVQLAVDAFALAGRLAFENRDDESAAALYGEATRTAARLEAPARRAAVRTSHTMVLLHSTNDLPAAEQLIRAAAVDARRSPGYMVQARVHAVQAEICARAGRGGAAAAALERAWMSLAQVHPGDHGGEFSANYLHGFEGLCALKAGAAEHAHDVLSSSLGKLTGDREAVQRGIVGSDLALARLILGDAVACTALLHEAVDVAAGTGGRVAAQRIRAARHELRAHREERFVAELDDHIHEAFIGR